MRDCKAGLIISRDAEMSTKKIRVGFGPKTSSNSYHQSGVKVASVLEQDERFESGFFEWEPYQLEELRQFDVLVFIKYYPPLEILRALKKLGKVLILDYQDMFLYPSVYETNAVKKVLKKVFYFMHEREVRRHLALIDICFVASPVLMDIVAEAGIQPYFLQRQLYNDRNESIFKQHNDRKDGLIIYWTGVSINQRQNEPIVPVLRELCRKNQCTIVYSTDAEGEHAFVEYRRWSRETWEREMLEADIAFRWRDSSSMQRCKDANKVMSYMGAGLPVVIYPTESEKRIIEHGVNGFFAFSVEEFGMHIERLITEPELRKRIGMRAHSDVWSRYSLRHQVQEIKTVVLGLAS